MSAKFIRSLAMLTLLVGLAGPALAQMHSVVVYYQVTYEDGTVKDLSRLPANDKGISRVLRIVRLGDDAKGYEIITDSRNVLTLVKPGQTVRQDMVWDGRGWHVFGQAPTQPAEEPVDADLAAKRVDVFAEAVRVASAGARAAQGTDNESKAQAVLAAAEFAHRRALRDLKIAREQAARAAKQSADTRLPASRVLNKALAQLVAEWVLAEAKQAGKMPEGADQPEFLLAMHKHIDTNYPRVLRTSEATEAAFQAGKFENRRNANKVAAVLAAMKELDLQLPRFVVYLIQQYQANELADAKMELAARLIRAVYDKAASQAKPGLVPASQPAVTRPDPLDVKPPSAQPTVMQVGISETGQVTVDGKMMAREDFLRVVTRRRKQEAYPVVLTAHQKAQWRQVSEVFNLLTEAGVKDISFKVEHDND